VKQQHLISGIGLRTALICLLIGVVLVPVAVTAADDMTPSPDARISIANISIDPVAFMTGDTGTVTVRVSNQGQTPAVIKQAGVSSTDFDVMNSDSYLSVGSIAPGSTREFTFSLKAKSGNGLYYPEVYFTLSDASSVKTTVPIRIDNSELQVSVHDVPDTFIKDHKNQISVLVFNPRSGNVNGVSVTPSGQAINLSSSSGFIGPIAADQTRNVSFGITPARTTNLTLTVKYRNGMNDHSTALTVPITVGDRTTAADPVVNSLEVSSSAGTYTLSGDVTNAGIDDARSIVVTIGPPAQPKDPNPVYVVGSLAADDFASFELTFTAQGATSVPLLVQYKDNEGNAYEKTVMVKLNQSAGQGFPGSGASGSGFSSSGQGGSAGGPPGGIFGMPGGGGARGGSTNPPILPIAILIVVLVVIGVAWRMGLLARVRGRFRK
jgi:hypothetical protein